MTSLADKYRKHRKVFALALEMGVTPKEAEAEMRRIESRERARAAQVARERLDAMLRGPLRPGLIAEFAQQDTDGRDPQPWMMRD